MKRLLLPLAAITIAGLLLPSGVRPAYACSCAPLPPQAHVDNADVIVIGTVSEVIDTTEQFPAPEEKSDGAIPDVDAVIEVERYLTGSGPAEIEVDDPPSGGTCGFLEQTSLGQRYLLFLTGEASPFKTHLCSGSTLLLDEPLNQEFLEAVLAITGPGTFPTTGSPSSAGGSGSTVPWLTIIIGSSLGAGALAAASAFLLRRLTRN